ncbi:MAG TPA: sigma factor [Acidimicrobiia bacterium]|nr:sigma factor [Acidimicrobiia bacterium]
MPSRDQGTPEVESFEAFYRREYTRMVAMARALLRNASAAEDLAQESFVTAHRHWDRIGAYDDPGAWVRRVLINRATSLQRRLGAEWRAVDRLGGKADETTVPELTPQTTEVWEEVRRLPRRQAPGHSAPLRRPAHCRGDRRGHGMQLRSGQVPPPSGRNRLSEPLQDWDEEAR